jgi:hypothetical protein
MFLRHLVVVAAVSGSLLTAVPTQAESPAGPLIRPCFKEPARWNTALDGALPKCPAFVPSAPEEPANGPQPRTLPVP